MSGPGRIGFKTSPQAVDWQVVDATWASAPGHGVWDAVWMNDHLTDAREERGGASLEALTLAATLAHRVPDMWIGHGVLSNTFRHPAVLAKAATVLDHATGGRFILALGAGWHEREHADYGIPLPPMPERAERFESAVEVLRALFSPAATEGPGVTRPDPYYPLDGARNEPPPRTPGGPPIWIGADKPRGMRLAARLGDGWAIPGDKSGDAAYLGAKRDELHRLLEQGGRDPSAFAIAGQVAAGDDRGARSTALEAARAMVAAGADHIIVSVRTAAGPEALQAAAEEIARPLRDAWP